MRDDASFFAVLLAGLLALFVAMGLTGRLSTLTRHFARGAIDAGR